MARQSDTELDLSGKTPPDGGDGGGGGEETPRRRGRPKGSTTKRPTPARAAEAGKAFEDGLKQIAGAFEDGNAEEPTFGYLLKRDAGKMAEVVGHWSAKVPALYRFVVLVFGPGSIVYAVRAFGPTFLHIRWALAERRERLAREAAEAAEAEGVPLA